MTKECFSESVSNGCKSLICHNPAGRRRFGLDAALSVWYFLSDMAPIPEDLTRRIKETLIEELMLEKTVEEIADEAPLFGPEGLGLDSVDALQLAVALDKHFGIKLQDQDEARRIMGSVQSIASAVLAKQGAVS
jgi:acyl carrier protein